MNIGFFDSGVGGIHILRHVIYELPDYHYLFLGDTENVPYGGKSDEAIYALVTKSLGTLFEKDCALVIFACNTASVTALRRIQDEFVPQFFPGRKVLGVIIPTVEEVFSQPTKTVGIIATERTIHSGKYTHEIVKRDPNISVVTFATPNIVPLIENGLLEEATQEAIKAIQENLIPHSPDTLVLGCTHYGLLKESLRTAFPEIRILAQEDIIPGKLHTYLERHPEIETRLSRNQRRELYLTHITPNYETKIREWIGDFPVSELVL